jgi:hypothetical protein
MNRTAGHSRGRRATPEERAMGRRVRRCIWTAVKAVLRFMGTGLMWSGFAWSGFPVGLYPELLYRAGRNGGPAGDDGGTGALTAEEQAQWAALVTRLNSRA